MINPDNDVVEVFEGPEGWHWHRKDKNNGQIVSRDASDGYSDVTYATEAAIAYNPGVPVELWIQNPPVGATDE